MNQNFFIIAAMALALAACTDKEQKDYEKVMASTDMTLLETYLETYKEAPIEHIGAVKKLLTELSNDSMMFAAVKEQSEIELRYEAAQEYLMKLPNGIHVDEVKKIIARDSAEVGKILAKREEAKAAAAAEAEYEDNYGTLRERIQNAQFIRETYSIVQLTVPDEEGKGCGAVGTVNSINPAVFFTYSVKPGTDNLVCCNIKNNHLFTITVYSDCVFLEGNGYSYYYQNNPVSEEEFREIEKYLREEVNKQMKNKKK